jgi:sugar O-acyltransferase (sialic acid O-acetyltransferase NeuD family)
MDNIVIVGSSGHARVVLDIVLHERKYNVVGFLDRFRAPGEQTMGVPILGGEEKLPELLRSHALKGAIVGIGDNFARSRVAAQIRKISPDLPFVSAIHPKASVAREVTIGEGTVVMAGAVINPCCSIGRFCVLNTNSSLDHDSVMDDFTSLAPGVTTGGGCRIGKFSAIGIGATLAHGIQVGEHAVVGAGALVLKPVESFVVAYGTPARTVRTRRPGEKYL